MNTTDGSAGGNGSSIEDQIFDLAIENIGRTPVQVGGEVRVTVDQVAAAEARRSLDGRHGVRVANQLGVVVVEDWRGDDVRASRKVNKSRSSS